MYLLLLRVGPEQTACGNPNSVLSYSFLYTCAIACFTVEHMQLRTEFGKQCHP